MAIDKRVLDFAFFAGFKIPKDDLSQDEILKLYQDRFQMTPEQANALRESVLEDELDEFFKATFGMVDNADAG